MKSRLFNLAAAVSLLLALAIIVLWLRSYGRREWITLVWHTSAEQHIWNVESRYSFLIFTTTRISAVRSPVGPGYEYGSTPYDTMDTRARRWFAPFAVRFSQYTPANNFDATDLAVAYWLLLPLALILPTLAIARHRRRRHRQTNNLCPTCGYDLRAHNPTDRCPECGMAPASSAARAAT